MVVLTASIIAVGSDKQAAIMSAVRAFDAFTADNDPHGEHHFGSLIVDGQRIFSEINYYDLTRAMHLPDAADPTITPSARNRTFSW